MLFFLGLLNNISSTLPPLSPYSGVVNRDLGRVPISATNLVLFLCWCQDVRCPPPPPSPKDDPIFPRVCYVWLSLQTPLSASYVAVGLCWHSASQYQTKSNTIDLILRLWYSFNIKRAQLRSHKSRDHTKITKELTNTFTMVVEPLTSPAVWIWWTHASQEVDGLVHIYFWGRHWTV